MKDSKTATVTKIPLIGEVGSEAVSLIGVIRRLSTSRSLQEVMEVVTHAARQLLAADGITFVLRDGDRCYYAEEDAISQLWKGRRFPMNACISGWCMTHKKAVGIEDIYSDSRIPHDVYRPTFVRSLAMVPVLQEEPPAAIGAYWSTPRKITQADLELLQSIANAAGLAVAYVNAAKRSHVSELPNADARPAAKSVSDGALASVRRWARWVPENSVQAFVFAAGCIVLAAGARYALSILPGGDLESVPFATFFPGILVATLIGGASAGCFALILGLVAAWLLFLTPFFAWPAAEPHVVSKSIVYMVAGGLIVWATHSYRRVVTSLQQKERERQLLTAELGHRARNTLAIVQAVVSRSLRDDPTRATTINRRVAAAIDTGDLATVDVPTELSDLIEGELLPFGEDRFRLSGAVHSLKPELAQAVALVIHEFTTNAAKYGALSDPSHGCVRVSWLATQDQLSLVWQETDGPAITSQPRHGFGTHMISQVLSGVGGTIRSDWREEGVLHEVRIPER